MAGTLTALVAIAALAVAYFAQYVLLLSPCELCLWERWPYRIVAVLGVLAALSPRRAAKVILGLAVLVLLISAGRAQGQAQTATISGTATDASGGALAGAANDRVEN